MTLLLQAMAYSISYFYVEKDVEAVKNAFLAKLQTDPDYYLRERSKYLKDVTESRVLFAQLTEKNTLGSQTIVTLKARFSLLYPFLCLDSLYIYRLEMQVPLEISKEI